MKIRHFLEYIIFLFFARVVNAIGIYRIKYIAKPLSLFIFYFLPIRKKVVLKNLRIAFPMLSADELHKIALKNYYSFAIAFLEILALRYANIDDLKNVMFVDNTELLKRNSEKKKGLILLTAHFGNWELGAIIMGLLLGKPLNVLSKRQKNIFVADWLKEMRERFGNKEIYIGMSVRELYSALKDDKVIGIVGDQRAPQKSVKVNFFNQSTPFFSGFTNLALKLRTPIIVAIPVRQNDFRYKVFLEELIYDDLTEATEENIQKMLEKYIEILQKFISLYPEQWFWMHNIWKYNR
jgi:KDO2-lipid IV(A) lauroyltransferase